ncbi:hypothetical protein H5410_005087 [Solanum commersonii]|uniref:Uncharacterized protein n=1 Tax=Solanum commersonii TaxID=4109 RepID=A0A9J6A5N6_SOLCO|nr:hypothetical protein H5410_005087 [Solanum commersonii]
MGRMIGMCLPMSAKRQMIRKVVDLRICFLVSSTKLRGYYLPFYINQTVGDPNGSYLVLIELKTTRGFA